MMRGKKLIATVLCTTMVGASLSACGSPNSSNAVTKTDAKTEKVLVQADENALALVSEFAETADKEVNYVATIVSGGTVEKETETTDTNATDDLITSLVDQNLNKEEGKDQEVVPEKTPEDYVDENGDLNVPFDIAYPDVFNSEDVEYADNAILVKVANKYSEDTVAGLREAGVGKMEIMFSLENYTWYTAYLLKGQDVNESMEIVRDVSGIAVAEYNFKYETALSEAETAAEAEVVSNPQYAEQWAKEKYGIRHAWYKHQQKTEEETGTATGGGSSSVVVAVIDTGVDYEHEDLQSNMWKNVNEIPNNGVDDDGNDYVDDYYGVDITNPYGGYYEDGTQHDRSGKDDNGHGTHVAGIIAAANNDTGVVGYAYNTKIMNIKAGDASGYFQQDDVAKAIIYAYEQGADVINMSFGGSASTIAVQDALAVAYSRCVLVASAGNDGAPNEYINKNLPAPNYPAALSYVLGVMSVGQNNTESSFTNWDAYGFNSTEYEVYAPGEQMISTLPGNRYGKLSGTSMAAPVVAAQAAMLRSYYSDTDMYSTKFIYGQIVGTAENNVSCLDPKAHGDHNIPGVINFYESITQVPVPEVSVSDYTLFDTAGYVADKEGLTEGCDKTNNGDGIVDAGETLALGFTLRNRWGMSENTTVHIDVVSDGGVENPYVTILNNDINYKSIGTYSENDCGKLYTEDGEMWNGWENPFYIKIAKNCPNDYSVKINVTVTCENALNPKDDTVYTTTESVLLVVRRGVPLSGKIEEDMTLTKDNYYIIENSLMIMPEATVTVEAGTQIQFWCSDPSDSYADNSIVYLNVAGKLFCEGTEEEPVEMFPSGWMDRYRVEIKSMNNGYVGLNYTNITNPYLDIDDATNCTFTQNYKDYLYYRYLSSGNVHSSSTNANIRIDYAKDCAFYKLGAGYSQADVYGKFEGCIFVDSAIDYNGVSAAENCVFYGNNNYWGEDYNGKNSSWQLYAGSAYFNTSAIHRNNDTGTTYIVASGSPNYSVAERVAKLLGGTIVSFENQEEFLEVTTAINDYHGARHYESWYTNIDAGLYKQDGVFYNYDGTSVELEVPETQGESRGYLLVEKCYPAQYIYDEQEGCDRWANERTNRLYYYYGTKPTRILDDLGNETIYEIPGEIYITNIALDDYLVNMDMEESYQIKATLTPKTADLTTLIYESQDEAVVTVDETGKVTPVGIGTTTVRVYAPDYAVYNYVTFNVNEIVPLESLSFANGEVITVNVEEPMKLKLVYGPAHTTKKSVTYKSSDETVLTVDERGIVTGLKEGQAVVTVTGYNDITASITVNVVVPAKALAFAKEVYATALYMEDGTAFYPVITPADTTNQTLVWESSNPEVCYVDEETGELVKLKAGTSVLRATLEGTELTDEILVSVTEELIQNRIVKMKSDQNQSMMFALMEDGTLWAWNNNFKIPTKLPIENVKDFMYSNHIVYILDDEGTVKAYSHNLSYSGQDEVYLTLDTSFTPLTKIVAMADQLNSGNSFFAITENGYAWAWGSNNGNGQLGVGHQDAVSTPMMVLIDEAITEIVATAYETMFLTEDGKAYYAGERSGGPITVPTCIYSNVEDIYVYNHEDAGMKTATGIYKFNYSSGNVESYTRKHENEFICEYEAYYVEDGKLYVRERSGSYSGEPVDVPGTVTSVFYVNKRFFIENDANELYVMGTGDNYLLGTGTAENVTIPRQLVFGLVENTDPITLQAINGITLENGVIPGHFEVRAGEPLVLDFNQALQQGGKWSYMTIENVDGPVRPVKTLDQDKLIVDAKDGFEAGYEYIVTIPANALVDRAGNTNAAITLTFVCTEGVIDVIPDEELTPDTEIEVPEEEEVINETVVDEELLAQRHFWTKEEVMDLWNEFVADGNNTKIYSNVILNRLHDDDFSTWLRIQAATDSSDGGQSFGTISFGGNYWGTTNAELINKQILDFDDFQSLYDINEGEILTEAPEDTYPFVVDAYLEVDGKLVETVGKDLVTFNVEFNRDMDTSIPLEVKFGSSYPYAEYKIVGEYVDKEETGRSRIWQGQMQLSTIIENGYQYWSVSNGKAADTSLKLYTDWGRFPFKIDTTAAQALTMLAEVTDTGINLTWTQDSFETLAGYNVYRSTAEDGQYTRLNKTVIPADTKEWFDDTVMPGQRYYYNFTVVESDMSESEPSGKVQATAMDTMAPNIYHSPVYHTFTGSNLVISAEVTDNVAISSATLFYRTTGDTEWKSKTMNNLNDKYSAVIPSADITTAGLEYYIAATDGNTYTYKGTEEAPYEVTVQLAVADSAKGDVDGNGAIELADALMVLMAINDRLNLTEEQFARADLDNSRELSASEALRILQYANGLISSVLP